jgi:cobalt-zinc-cadmium efflux system outer membrane protein
MLEIVRVRASAGESSGYDLRRLELELGAHEDLVLEAEYHRAISRRSVAALIGETRELTDPLDIPQVPTSSEAGLRSDLRSALLRIGRAEEELAAAGRAWVPELTLSAGLKTSPIGEETAFGYVLGAALTLPFFDHGQAEYQRALADKRTAEAEARRLERDATLEIANARDGLLRRKVQAERYRDVLVPKLEAMLRQAETSYREGERPIFELIEAHRTAREVRLRALALRREAKRSELELMRALGSLGGKP